MKLIDRARDLATNCTLPRGIDTMLWRDLSAADRFYVKGIDSEKHGIRQVGTYQEYARVMGLSAGYTALMASMKANEARLKTASELGMRTFGDLPGFDDGVLRRVLEAVHISIKEDESPEKGLAHLKTELGADYWANREKILALLAFFAEAASIATMAYWHPGAKMAGLLRSLVESDHV